MQILQFVLYASDIVRLIKIIKLKWAGHVACMGDNTNAYVILLWKPEGRNQLGDLKCYG
jgi:hypothetical protein